MRLPLLAFAFMSAFALGCSPASSGGEPSFPATRSLSYSSGSSSFSSSSPTIPQHEAVLGAIVVRPDLLCIPFALHTTAEDPDKAITALRTAIDAIGQRVGAAAGGQLQVRMRGFAIAPSSYSKKADEKAALEATADGALELPLTEELDYWARSRRTAAIQAAIAKEKAAYTDGPMKAQFSPLQPQVRDPEAHRAKLVEQWVKRARAFAEAAQSPAAPLHVTDCAAPGAITQRSISDEEVALSLPIACHMDVAGTK